MHRSRRVVEAHASQYPDPIAVSPGDRVDVERRDTEWPAFLWCTSADDKQGWVSERILRIDGGRAVVQRAPSVIELAVQPGGIGSGIAEEGGWFWCEREGGDRGWIPTSCVEREEKT